jgi:hypothetical protein
MGMVGGFSAAPLVNDGEVGKPSFNAYVHQRLSGFDARPSQGSVRRGQSTRMVVTRNSFPITTRTCWLTVHSKMSSAWRRGCALVRCAMSARRWCSETLPT